MCFSASASFLSAICVGAVGLATFQYVRSKKQIFLAAVPCFFALQQAAEGVLWLTLGDPNTPHPMLQRAAMDVFLFFALFFWPFWSPFAFYALEEDPTRKKLQFICLLLGIVVVLVNMYYAFTESTAVSIVGGSLQYSGNLSLWEKWFYGAAVILPIFISSFKNAWQYGILVLATILMADYFYYANFVSVWCFFAAITSVIIFKIFRDNAKAIDQQS